jgi:Rrf2 family protein
MKLITRDTDYALRALCYIHQHNNTVTSVTQLVDDLGVPRSFLRKLLQRLSQAHIVESYRGLGGGFRLAVPSEKIGLVDLIIIFQGPVKLSDCSLKKKPCPRQLRCPLHEILGAMEEDVLHTLRKMTIASLTRSFIAAGFYER